MNQLTSNTTGNAISTGSGTNYFESYGDAISQRKICGKILKFSKGDFLAGESNDEVAIGTTLIANMDELHVGWIKWQDNRPVEQIMGKIASGYQPPKRNTLGDDDKDKWEVDEQGQQRDPFQYSNYLIMKEPGGEELYTFTTSSRGGLNAIGELCKSYGKAMRQRPNEFPIVALKVGSYAHSNKSFGRIKFPVFEVTGWAPKSEFADALADEAANTAAEQAPEGTATTTNATATVEVKKTAATKKTAAAETRF